MDRDEALKLLRGGRSGVAEWNRRCLAAGAGDIPSMAGVDLVGADLLGVILRDIDLSSADLRNANLSRAHITGAHFFGSRLDGANLSESTLLGANFICATLAGTDFGHSRFLVVSLAGVRIAEARNLEYVQHIGPTFISTDTLVAAEGRLPEVFLRGCGLTPWEIEAAKLYDPALTQTGFCDIQTRIFGLRSQPMLIGGVFISYSHQDSAFVDKLHAKLAEEKASVWLDRHDAVAGPLKRQVADAIRVNDVVLLVLSEASVRSDWVEYELESARKKEKEEGRDVLCPVMLDDAWKAKTDDPLWRQVKKYLILDFSKWKTKAFAEPFAKLMGGLKKHYGPVPKVAPP